MLEQLYSPEVTHGGENTSAESISRKDTDLAWLAGFIDGEGCFYTGTRYVNGGMKLITLVTITNSHPMAIRRATEILCKYGVGFNIQAMQPKSKSRPQATIRIEGKRRISKLLDLIGPFLVVKQDRAQIMQKLISYRETLADNYTGNRINDSGQFVGTVADDATIQEFISSMREATNNYPSVLEFSRKPNRPFGESSETTRLPLAA